MNSIEIKTLLSDEDREAIIEGVIERIRPLLDRSPSQSANGRVPSYVVDGKRIFNLNRLVDQLIQIEASIDQSKEEAQ